MKRKQVLGKRNIFHGWLIVLTLTALAGFIPGGISGISSPGALAASPPSVTTGNATSVTSSSVQLSGTVTSLGSVSSANVSFQWGVSSGDYSFETPSVSMNATGPFSANLTGLSGNTTYYYRAKAVGDNTGYGDEDAFTTLFGTPTPVDGGGVPPAWVRQFGSGSPSGGTFVYGVAVDNQGYAYMAGSTYGALPGQTAWGSLDGFIRKYDASGNELWTRQFGSSSADSVNALVVDASGNAYLVGYTDGALPGQTDLGDIDAFIRKYDNLGNEVWTRQFGTSRGDHAYGAAVDLAGNIFVSGDTPGAFPGYSSLGDYDGFIRKYDNSGEEVWTRQFGTPDADHANSVAVDREGNVYSTGEIEGDASFGFHDAFVRKFDTSGNPLWMRRFDTGSADFADSVAVDAVSSVYVAGYTLGALPGQPSFGDYDGFLRKYDSSGNDLWSRQIGTPSQDIAFGISEDNFGNIFVFGMTEGTLPGQTSSGSSDAFIRTYDSSGNVTWTHQFGAGAATSVYDSAMGLASDFYVVGETFGTLPGQTSTGQRDVFIAKFTAPSVPTNSATDITINSARLNGTLSSTGSASSANVSFLLGTTPGNYTNETTAISMNSTGAFSATLPGLSANTTYYFQTKAVGHSSALGTEQTFTTLNPPSLPHTFYGTVKLNSKDAPAGTTIEARAPGVVFGANNPYVTNETGKYGGAGPFQAKLIVQGTVVEGAPIEFVVNGVKANETANFASGNVTMLNLTAETPPVVEWSRTFGGAGSDIGYSVQQTSDGGYIITGYTEFGSGGLDAYLIKADAAGNMTWSRTFGGLHGWGHSVRQTQDGGYIIAGYTENSFDTSHGDILLIKTDATGNLTWQRTFGGADQDFGYSVHHTDDGGYVLVGSTNSFGAGSADVYLIKTDESGNMTWSRTFGGANNDVGKSVRPTTDGGYIISGMTYSFGAGGADVYLIKTDVSGNMTWSRTFGGMDYDDGRSVQPTDDGGYIIAGMTLSFGIDKPHAYLIKTDASGNLTWQQTFRGTGGGSHANSVQVTPDRGYVITGSTFVGVLDSDVYLAKTNASGNMTWQKGFGGGADDQGYSVQPTADGGYIIAGYTASFGIGGNDVYLIKLGPPIPPSVTTGNAAYITFTSAWLSGNLTSPGSAGSANVSFQWGPNSGNYTFETPPVSMNVTGFFGYSVNITSLSANTTYYFRAKAVGDGTGYGEEKIFITLPSESPPPGGGRGGNISGTIHYSGPVTGNHDLYVFSILNGGVGTGEAYSGSIIPFSGSGNYTYSLPVTAHSFPPGRIVIAVLDATDSGVSLPLNFSGSQPMAVYPRVVPAPQAGQERTGIDMDISAPGGSISGNISYSGNATGYIRLILLTGDPVPLVQVTSIYISTAGSYIFPYVPAGMFSLFGWRDVNGNSLPEDTEPQGYFGLPQYPYADPITVLVGEQKSGIDFSIYDATTVSGTVTYLGTQVPNPQDFDVHLHGHRLFVDENAWGTIHGTGAFTMQNVPAGISEWSAWLDADRSGGWPPTLVEPMSDTLYPLIIAGQPVSDVQLVLTDTVYGLIRGLAQTEGLWDARGTTVTARGSAGTFTTSTTPWGFYFVSLPVGTYQVTISRPGYLPVIMQNINVTPTLEPPLYAEITLPTVIFGSVLGDANGDGLVNALDITKIERIIVGLDAPTAGADANQDGNINAIDITKVERLIAGLD